MPTYQYRCAKCGDQFEEWQSIHDAALKRHRGGCGGKLDKVLSVGGIVLKGSGFYKTDNRTPSKAGRSDSSSSDGQSGSSSDSSSSEKSPAPGSGSGAKGSGSNGNDAKSSSKKDPKTPSKSGAAST